MAAPQPPYDWGYQFATGFKWSADMTRDELMQVITGMRHEIERHRTDRDETMSLLRQVARRAR